MITNSPKETQELAKKILPLIKETNLICLYGELGSGKTTFVQGLAKELGIKQQIISPTFVIIKEYTIMDNVSCVMDNDLLSNHLPIYPSTHYSSFIHIDCYRLESEKDLKSVSLKEYWSSPKNLVIIEWPERIKNILPKKRLEIKFEHIDETTRKIDFIHRYH